MPEIKKAITVKCLEFNYHPAGQTYNYDTRKTENVQEHWTGRARVASGGDNIQDIDFKLTPELSGPIMRMLMPIVNKSAADAAQRLADEAKAQMTELTERVMEQLPESSGVSPQGTQAAE